MKSRLVRASALLVPVALLAVAGCTAGGGSSGGDDNSLVILTPIATGTASGDVLREVIADFTEETGIETRVDFAGGDLPTVFETSTAAGAEADIVHINLVDKPLTWAEAGLTITVDDLLDDWDIRDKIIPEALEEFTQDYGVPAFPYEGYQWPVWYNMDLLGSVGIDKAPETIDELIDAADALRAAGIQPMAIGGGDWSGEKLFTQFAQNFLDADTLIGLFREGGWCANPEAMEGIELFTDVRDAGVFIDDAQGYTWESMTASFLAGESAIMPAGSWTIAENEIPEDFAANVYLGGLPIPSGSVYDLPTGFQGASNAWWISKNGEAKLDLVKQFIQYMFDPKTVARFVVDANMIMATQADVPADAEANPLVAASNSLSERMDYAVALDQYVPGNLNASLIRETTLAYTPGQTPEAICAAIDAIYP